MPHRKVKLIFYRRIRADSYGIAGFTAGIFAEGNIAFCSGGESLTFLADVIVVINDINRDRINRSG